MAANPAVPAAPPFTELQKQSNYRFHHYRRAGVQEEDLDYNSIDYQTFPVSRASEGTGKPLFSATS